MLRNLNPDRLLVALNGAENSATGIVGAYTQSSVDYLVPRHLNSGDYQIPANITTSLNGVVLAAIGGNYGIINFLETDTYTTEASFKDNGTNTSDINDDGSDLYVVGNESAHIFYIHKYGRDGTFTSGQKINQGTATSEFESVWSDSVNIFAGGHADFGGTDATLITKWDTSLNYVLGKRSGVSYGTIDFITGDSNNIYFVNGSTKINSYLKSDLTLNEDKTLNVSKIGSILPEGSNLIVSGYGTSSQAFIGSITNDLTTANSAVIQDTGTDVRLSGMVKLGTSYFCVGQSQETDQRGVILEFDSSFNLLNAKALGTASTFDMAFYDITTDGTDLFISVWDSTTYGAGASTNGILRIKNGDISGSTLNSDNPGFYTWQDYTITFTSFTITLTAVAQNITTAFSPTPSSDTATDLQGAADSLTQFE